MPTQKVRVHSFLQMVWLVFFLAGCNLSSTMPPTETPTLRPERLFTATVRVSTPIPPSSTPLPAPTRTLAATVTMTPFPTVSVEKVAISSKFMSGMKRVASIYLPGEYADNPNKRYKVLYAFDGQQLPLIAFEQYLNSLFASHQVEPIIVVGIDALDGDLRHEELGTGPTLNVFGWGTLSDSFNKFVVNELLPKIDSAYRTQATPQGRGIMGWSLGGLTSFYLAWQYPDRFGVVGSFSPSFWWRTESKMGYELQSRVIHNMVLNSQKRSGLRMWFEAGTKEEPYSDMDKNGVIDVIQDIQDLWKVLERKGYKADTDMVYLQVEGGAHAVTTWARVLPDFLRFAFPYP
jgi:iron(III)-enterobactin esterase